MTKTLRYWQDLIKKSFKIWYLNKILQELNKILILISILQDFHVGSDTVCKLDGQESRDKDYNSEGLRYWESTTKNDNNYNNNEKRLIISNCLAKGVVSGNLILVDSMF